MSATSLYRAGAVCLIGSFVLSLAGGMLHPVIDGQSHSAETFLAPGSPGAQMLIYAGALLLMLGLPTAIAYFRSDLGRLGVVGLVVYFLGNALSAQSHLVVEGFVGPALAADDGARHLIPDDGTIVASPPFVLLQVVGGLVLVGGLLLLAVAMIRRPAFPTPVGALLLAGSLALMVPVPEQAVLTGLLVELPRGLAVATLGVLMLRELGSPVGDEPVREPVATT